MEDASLPGRAEARMLEDVCCLFCGHGEVYSSLEELAQISHLEVRWCVPVHLKTKMSGRPWIQWVAVVALAC